MKEAVLSATVIFIVTAYAWWRLARDRFLPPEVRACEREGHIQRVDVDEHGSLRLKCGRCGLRLD